MKEMKRGTGVIAGLAITGTRSQTQYSLAPSILPHPVTCRELYHFCIANLYKLLLVRIYK